MRRYTLGRMLSGPRTPRARRSTHWTPSVVAVEERVMPSVTIMVDYTYDTTNFFDTQAKRDLMKFAADTVGATLNDALTAITPSGGNSWSATFPGPSTGSTVSISNLSVPANTLVIYVGGSQLGGLTEAGQGSTGGFTASSSTGDQNWLNTVAARGQAGALLGSPTDYGTWGGSISYDNSGSTNWFFGQTTAGLGVIQTDFLSVAEHEIGHVLGLGTAASWNNKVSGGFFRGGNAVAAFGGQPVPVNAIGDHFAQSVQSDGGPALMNPALVTGTRVKYTSLDYAALKDVGWQVQAASPSTFQFGSSTYSTLETNPSVTMTVTRTGGLGAASVNYFTANGTATAGRDYTATSGSLNFGAGETSKTMTVPILNDNVADGVETFAVALNAPSSGNQIGNPATTTVSVVDPGVYRPAGDYDGDGKTDLSVFRPTGPLWITVRSTAGLVSPLPTFGAPNLIDIPLVGDFDGTGRAERAVFRPSTAQWIVDGPNGARVLGAFGATNLFDIPVPGDYDGVGYTQMAVFRPSTSQWFVMGVNGTGHLLGAFGAPNLFDIPAPGDYDGTGKTEMAVFRPSTAQWFVMGPTGGRLLGTFGGSNLLDVPVPGDYDGTGRTQMAVFRPSTSDWFVNGPTGGRLLVNYGLSNYVDLPVVASVASLMKRGATGPRMMLHGFSIARSNVPAPSTAQALSNATITASKAPVTASLTVRGSKATAVSAAGVVKARRVFDAAPRRPAVWPVSLS